MRPEIVMLAPEQAAALIEADTTNLNRKFDKDNYQKFVRLIQAGLWKTTNQGIAITTSGRIIDGQHRLAAIRDTGIPCQVMICWDADENTFDAIDQGKKRSGNDIWQLGGHSGGSVAAIGKMVWCYENLDNTHDWHNASRHVTSAEVFSWANDRGYARAIQNSSNYEHRVRKEIRKIGCAMGAAFAISEIYAGLPPQEVYESVFEPLIRCVGLQEGMPVYVLHRILSRRDHRDAMSTGNVFCTKLASNAIINRARLGILLRVIADTFQGRSRLVYQFSTTGSLPDMARLGQEVKA